jgi:hypothetical protein
MMLFWFALGLLVGGVPSIAWTLIIERLIFKRLRLHVCDNDRHTH